MASRLMGPVDTIWLNMDRPDNLMIIDSLMLFEGKVDWDRAREVVRRRLLDRFPVFSQRPVQPFARLGPPRWTDDTDFDLDRHVVHATLDRPDDLGLRRYIEPLMPVPFDRAHPLWEMHLIDGHHEGSAVFSRIHHSLADGLALNQVLLSLTDAAPDADLAEPPLLPPVMEEPAPQGVLGQAARLAGTASSAVLGTATNALTGVFSGAVTGAARLIPALPRLLDPRLPGDTLGNALVQAQRTGATANKLLLTGRPQTPLTGPLTTAKRAVWSAPFPLSGIKHLGHRTGTTVNDVLMGAVAGALATYMKEQGSEPEDVPTMVPVNVRPLDRPPPRELGNRFALVLFIYPSSLGTPIERIMETHRRMEAIKQSPEVSLTFGLIKAIGRTGPELERYLVDFFAGKAIGVTTNVPGPVTGRYLAGTKINGVLAWAPGSGSQAVSVSIYTYDGSVRVGFKTDASCVPEPERLLRAFDEEISGLLRLSQAV